MFNRYKINSGIKPTLIANLARIRKEHRISVRALADRSGVSKDRISACEYGRTILSPSQVRQIAECIGVDIEEFYKK